MDQKSQGLTGECCSQTHDFFPNDFYFSYCKPCFHQSYRITTSISCCLIILKKKNIKMDGQPSRSVPMFLIQLKWFSTMVILTEMRLSRSILNKDAFYFHLDLLFILFGCLSGWSLETSVSFVHIKKLCLPIYFLSCSYINIDMRSAQINVTVVHNVPYL